MKNHRTLEKSDRNHLMVYLNSVPKNGLLILAT